MKKSAFMVATIMIAAAPALAGPKDKNQLTLLNPDPGASTVVDNALTKTKVKLKGCQAQIQMKPVTGLTDGDIVICILAGDAALSCGGPASLGSGNFVVGEAKKGQVKIKADLTDVGCGALQICQYNFEAACYLDDFAWRTTDWMTDCTGQGGTALPNSNPDPKTLKGDPTQPIVGGSCAFLSGAGGRLAGPSSTQIAVDGLRIAP